MNTYTLLLQDGSWHSFFGGSMQITELGQIIIYETDVMIYTNVKAVLPSNTTLIVTKNKENENIQ